jgi:isoamylase
LLLLSQGTPMLLMGDEVRRTQQGNNNPYCQDNELSWFDWTLLERHADVHRFTKRMIDLRLHPEHLTVSEETSLNEVLKTARIHWHGVRLFEPDWSDASRSLAVTVRFAPSRLGHLMLNAWSHPLEFELPPAPRMSVGGWLRQFDTALPSPDDIADPGSEPAVDGQIYTVAPHSTALVTASLTRRG